MIEAGHPRIIGAEDFWASFSYANAAEALLSAFADGLIDGASSSTVLPLAEGELLLMVSREDRLGAGVKVLSLTPENPRRGQQLIDGCYIHFDPKVNSVSAVVDGAALTAARTATVSAIATQRCARPDAERMVVIGAGAQARAHIEAIPTLLPIREVTVVDLDQGRAESLATHARGLGLMARAGDAASLGSADVICTCTSSSTAVFDSESIRDHVHVNAVGGFEPGHRELDGPLMARASVVVEDVEIALREAGDIISAQDEGFLPRGFEPRQLRVVLNERSHDLRSGVSVFESIGLAAEDFFVVRDLLASG